MTIELKPIPSAAEITAAVRTLIAASHGRAWNAGWYHDLNGYELGPKNFGDACSLIHSEISEAYEAHRKDNAYDDKLTLRRGKDVELIDAAIRIFDDLGAREVDPLIFVEKMVYNDHRLDHKIENRAKAGGKKH